MRVLNNIRVGKPHTSPSSPSHTQGIKEGNEPGNLESEPGYTNGKWTPRRSTGVNPNARGPIDKKMPVLPPA